MNKCFECGQRKTDYYTPSIVVCPLFLCADGESRCWDCIVAHGVHLAPDMPKDDDGQDD